jgi:hypothetical protein
VCLDDFEDADKSIRVLRGCGHVFCVDCVTTLVGGTHGKSKVGAGQATFVPWPHGTRAGCMPVFIE